MRQQCAAWKYQSGKDAAELEELRLMVYRWIYLRMPSARSYLLAVARERQVLLDELAKLKEET